jgi:predicted nucleic acid-binding protein
VAYLVDTDILIDYLRHQEAAADYLDSLGEWSLSVVSGMELVAGALNNDEVREIDTVLATYRAAPVSAEIGQLAYNPSALTRNDQGVLARSVRLRLI